jgi:hypothetical protein
MSKKKFRLKSINTNLQTDTKISLLKQKVYICNILLIFTLELLNTKLT